MCAHLSCKFNKLSGGANLINLFECCGNPFALLGYSLFDLSQPFLIIIYSVRLFSFNAANTHDFDVLLRFMRFALVLNLKFIGNAKRATVNGLSTDTPKNTRTTTHTNTHRYRESCMLGALLNYR